MLFKFEMWQPGDIAMGRLAKRLYGKVRIVRDEDEQFFGQKVLSLSNGTYKENEAPILAQCYFVEVLKSGTRMWLPSTGLHLPQRSRPFYGPVRNTNVKKSPNGVKKRKIREDVVLPLNASKIANITKPDLNTSLEKTHTPKLDGIRTKYENAFKEFVRRCKESIFDDYLLGVQQNLWKMNVASTKYLLIDNVPTEDKFEILLQNVGTTEKEVESHLYQCWRYNVMYKIPDASDSSETLSPSKEVGEIKIHTTWCIVCGKRDDLKVCLTCPAAFHSSCVPNWLHTIQHRKILTQSPVSSPSSTFIPRLRSANTKSSPKEEAKEIPKHCPSCSWGPRVGYGDVVWHKLGTCSWWPALVLPPGQMPSSLLARKHSPHCWPVRYYGTENHAWADYERMTLFLPSHTAVLDEKRSQDLQEAVLDACDDYIRVYLG